MVEVGKIEIMSELKKNNEDTMIKLATMKMPFGKYGGRILIDLPEAYLAWFARKGFPEGEIGRLLEILYEIKLNGLEYLFKPIRRK